ncbi:hypothetical protein FXB40_19215 [Bradyrhizobium rifense]|uniref:Uncharacterized protein n=1 Tax=Bradyrhizobium rifense TaxID=515499 RepID=A0A5D3KFX0_9BRAD|nr:hypothetical protein FXB40_19215 [Bradyrhizobium rifense]
MNESGRQLKAALFLPSHLSIEVGNYSGIDPPATIPVEHSAKLIALGYMVDLVGRLRMTTPGRQLIAVGLKHADGPS